MGCCSFPISKGELLQIGMIHLALQVFSCLAVCVLWSMHWRHVMENTLFFWCSSSVYSCHRFLVPSASLRSIPFPSFIVPIFAWRVPLVFLIFKKSQVFPVLLFFSTSLPCSLKEAFLPLLAILWSSAFRWVYISFSPLSFTSLLGYLQGLLRQPFCLFAFLFLGDSFDQRILYHVMNLCPQCFRHSIRSNHLNLFGSSTALRAVANFLPTDSTGGFFFLQVLSSIYCL